MGSEKAWPSGFTYRLREVRKHGSSLKDCLNLHILRIILQDSITEPRNPTEPIAVSNFHSRTDTWKESAAASSLFPFPAHRQGPETRPWLTITGSYVSHLLLRFPWTCTPVYLKLGEILNFFPHKWSYCTPRAYCNRSCCSHFLRELGGNGTGFILHNIVRLKWWRRLLVAESGGPVSLPKNIMKGFALKLRNLSLSLGFFFISSCRTSLLKCTACDFA